MLKIKLSWMAKLLIGKSVDAHTLNLGSDRKRFRHLFGSSLAQSLGGFHVKDCERGKPRKCWREHISYLAMESLGDGWMDGWYFAHLFSFIKVKHNDIFLIYI